jgi:predicted MFS family arabinose efflux permease
MATEQASTSDSFFSAYHLAPNSMTARTFLAFLATAGLFYVNIMPALVDGLIQGLNFTNKEAGFVGSANVYGAAAGALAAVFLIKRISWKPVSLVLLLGLVLIDFLSMMITDANTLIGTRFVHGLVGGLLVGIGFAIIARTEEADITFGLLLLVQFGFGGVGVMYLPPLVPEYGPKVLFMSLIAFDLVTLLMLPFLSAYPAPEKPKAVAGEANTKAVSLKPMLLTLLAIFLFQAANMGPYAYIVGLGTSSGLEMDFISPTLGAAAWIGIVGSLLVVVFSTRFGRTLPVISAIIITALGTFALLYSELPWVYVVANCGVGITWAFVIPYLFGMCAEFDKAGQMAAIGGFASKLGLASGPLAAAFLVGEGNYVNMIYVACASLLCCMAVVIMPARMLDRAARSEKMDSSNEGNVAEA